MPRVSAAFFAVGVICVLAGMIWGIVMGISENFLMAPAHAHLNLIGWATMALYGTFYALTRETLSVRLAWWQFAVSTLGLVVLIPSLALFLAGGNDPKYHGPVAAGSLLTLLGMALFAISVGRELLRRRTA
jgi:hypothetical protein